MSADIHEQARQMISAAGEDLPSGQRVWLDAHLGECAECSVYAEAAGQAISGVRSEVLAATYSLVRETQRRVRAHGIALRQRRERLFVVWLSCLFVGTSTAITTPVFWHAFEWVGLRTGISDWAWQAAFAFFSIVPALAVSALLLAHGTHLNDTDEKQWL